MTGAGGPPLRFVLLAGGDGVERWLGRAIADAEAAGHARCVGVATAEPTLQLPNRAGSLVAVLRTPAHWTHFALRATVLRSPLMTRASFADALPGVPVGPLAVQQSGSVVRLAARSVADLRAQSLDFILLGEFGFLKGDVLDAARFGVWSHHHGDPRRYRGRPSCFWELHDGAPEVSAGIQQVNETLDGGHFMGLVTVPTEPSFSRTVTRLYEASTTLLATTAEHVRCEGTVPPAITLPDPLPPVHRRPTNRQVGRAVRNVVGRRLRRRGDEPGGAQDR